MWGKQRKIGVFVLQIPIALPSILKFQNFSPYNLANCGGVLRADRPSTEAMASTYQSKIESFRSYGTLALGAALHAPCARRGSKDDLSAELVNFSRPRMPVECACGQTSAGKMSRRLRQCRTYHRRTSHYVHRHESAILISVEHRNKKERRISCKKGISHATVPRF